jgi:iron complex outermembrane receptor protein
VQQAKHNSLIMGEQSMRTGTRILMYGLGSVTCGIGSAWAQEPSTEQRAGQSGVADIVVTAQKRSESAQRVPIAITAFSADQLQAKQIRGPEDLASRVPGLQVDGVLGAGVPVFSLRGISMLDYSLAQDGPVATYYDEVYKGNLVLLGVGVFDLERVEVLKGPQGTLYGKNTTGGAVNLISRKPGRDPGGYITAGFGNYDHLQVDGAYQAPLTNTLSARVAFTVDRAQGYVNNVAPGGHDANGTRQWAVRGSLRWQPSDDLDVILRASTSHQDPYNFGQANIPVGLGAGGAAYAAFGVTPDSRPGLGRREINDPTLYRRNARTYSVSGTIVANVSDGLTLTSITAWDKGHLFIPVDTDGGPLRVLQTTYDGRTTQVSQDLRLANDSSSRFTFILGAYGNRERLGDSTIQDIFQDIDFNGDGAVNRADCVDSAGGIACQSYNSFHQQKVSLAGYTDMSFALTDKVKLRGGLRYTHDRGKLRDYLGQVRDRFGVPVFNTIPGSATDLYATTSRDFTNNNVSGKIGIDVTPSSNLLLYATLSRGYRASSFNGSAVYSPEALTVAKPETVNAAEIGFKSQLADNRLRVNASAFYYGYKNQQIIDAIATQAGFVQELVNLPKSRIAGAETEIEYRPSPNFGATLAIGYLSSKILKGTYEGADIRGNQLVNAPHWTIAPGVDGKIPLGDWGRMDANADLAFTSRQYFDSLNRRTISQESYAVLNARVRVHPNADRWGLSVWAKNLTNTFAYTYMADASAVGFIFTQQNAPRTYGVTLDAKF